MIHFDFEERYQDEQVVGRALPAGNIVVLSVLLHLLVIFAIQFAPRLTLFLPSEEELKARQEELLKQQRERERNERRFVFIQPQVDIQAPKPKPDVDVSDLDRRAQAPQRAVKPENPLPFALGNSPERVEQAQQERARGAETAAKPNVSPPQPDPREQVAQLPRADQGIRRSPDTSRPAPGALGEALRNLQRYVQNETFHNEQGGANDPGATIQFDSKGIDFGPWLRRFVAQVRRNWFVPYAAMTFRGRVVLQFNIHKNGTITDVAVVAPSDIDAFNRAAHNAILGSNPTEPLPPDYPDPVAFFTVTFYYNEQPPLR